MSSFSKLNILSLVAVTITLAGADSFNHGTNSLNPSHLFGFVRDETCEYYGMHSIHDSEICRAAFMLLSEAEGLKANSFLCHTDPSLAAQRSYWPIGCSYHPFGYVQQAGDWAVGNCDAGIDGPVEGKGCFCIKDSFGFVRDETCEYYGMRSIYDPAQCNLAGETLVISEGLRNDIDFNFHDRRTVSPQHSKPTGCSYHPFGNVEQWGEEAAGNCDAGSMEGCFCIMDCDLY